MTEINDHLFRILVCVDGSDESNRALRYAVRIGSGTDADLTLLYVRPIDQGMRTGGLQISVARENLLDWGLDLPGMNILKKSRDVLIDSEFLAEGWDEEFVHTDVRGDPLGDNSIIYHSEEGRSICLKLMVSSSVVRGILDECEQGNYDITIIPKSDARTERSGLGFIEPNVAEIVATEYEGTVLVARELEQSHGHLVCVIDNDVSIQAARRDAEIAGRCACPVYLFSVALDETEVENAERAITKAKVEMEKSGISVSGEKVVIGDPVESIIEEGKSYSVIVLSPSTRAVGWRRFFTTGVAYKVLQHAHNSVMIAR